MAYAKRPALMRAAVLRVSGTLGPTLIFSEIRNHRDVDVLTLIGLDAPVDTDKPHDERHRQNNTQCDHGYAPNDAHDHDQNTP